MPTLSQASSPPPSAVVDGSGTASSGKAGEDAGVEQGVEEMTGTRLPVAMTIQAK